MILQIRNIYVRIYASNVCILRGMNLKKMQNLRRKTLITIILYE